MAKRKTATPYDDLARICGAAGSLAKARQAWALLAERLTYGAGLTEGLAVRPAAELRQHLHETRCALVALAVRP